jgi:hypothetical protein
VDVTPLRSSLTLNVRLKPSVLPPMMIRSFAVITILVNLLGCASPAEKVSLPFVSPINELDAPKVRWSLPTTDHDYPSVTLVDQRSGAELSRTRSVFGEDWVASMGKPEGDSLKTLRSATNRTILVHECASESSPDEHIIIFSKSEAGTWTVQSAFPPHQPSEPPKVYGHYGVSRGIDDAHLYYQFHDGELRCIPFSELEPRMMNHEQ